MQKTKIEWADYTWNPVKGLCPQACWYCYARAMYKRFKWNPELRLDQKELSQLILFKTNYPASKRIFVGSTIDLFHPQIPKDWIETIVNLTGLCSEHTFLFLTKNPARYAEFDFPKNCWLGVTVTGPQDLWRIEKLVVEPLKSIGRVLSGEKKEIRFNLCFVSLEPFLLPLTDFGDYGFQCLDWVIIGALTGPKAKGRQPKKKWIEDIMDFYNERWEKRSEHRPALFLKNNLKAVWGEDLIQEHPDRRKNP